jgi:hypothetical protein
MKIDEEKKKIAKQLEEVKARMSLLEVFEQSRYNTEICKDNAHSWHLVETQKMDYGYLVQTQCIRCGISHFQKYTETVSWSEDEFAFIREEEE